MSMSRYQVLTDSDVDQFLAKGFVAVRGCFSRAAAEEFTRPVWDRLGYAADDPSTWAEPVIHLAGRQRLDVRDFAPKAWAAVCDLVGGEERISADRPYVWSDSFIVNLWQGADEPWAPAAPTSPGWHKDGDFFRHFLDSPEQGLLTLVLWSDVRHQGGATFVAADSVAPVAFADLIAPCREFVEATGEAGDVYLLHPYILHAKSQNVLRLPRIITNPPLTLAEPMRFDRSDPSELSLVERAVLHALDRPRHEFTPAAGRQELVPPRVAMQRERMAEEERRAGLVAGRGVSASGQ
jgi:hypothetical protein